MARKSGASPKSETLSIRLDPKIRFVLEFLSRAKGQSLTTIVERAITDSGEDYKARSEDGDDVGWRDLFSVSDGVRALNLAGVPSLYPTFEELRRLAFVREHWPFFYTGMTMVMFREPYLDILWPNIDDYIEIHEKRKSGGEYWAASDAMRDALAAARLKPPEWPISEAARSFENDMDSEIPF